MIGLVMVLENVEMNGEKRKKEKKVKEGKKDK